MASLFSRHSGTERDLLDGALKINQQPKAGDGLEKAAEMMEEMKLGFFPVWEDAGGLSWITAIPKDCPVPKLMLNK